MIHYSRLHFFTSNIMITLFSAPLLQFKPEESNLQWVDFFLSIINDLNKYFIIAGKNMLHKLTWLHALLCSWARTINPVDADTAPWNACHHRPTFLWMAWKIPPKLLIMMEKTGQVMTEGEYISLDGMVRWVEPPHYMMNCPSASYISSTPSEKTCTRLGGERQHQWCLPQRQPGTQMRTQPGTQIGTQPGTSWFLFESYQTHMFHVA